MPDDGLQAATVSTGEASKKGIDLSAWVDRNLTFVFNIPTVVFLAALVAFPVGIVIYTSFTDWQLITNQESKGVWFANYFSVWSDARWNWSIFHTFYYAGATVVGQLILLSQPMVAKLSLQMLLWQR